MKKLLTLIVLISIHLSSLAQNEVFRIDSIPMQGILLDKGWKNQSEVVNLDSNFRKRNNQFSKPTQDSNVSQRAILLAILNIGFFLVLSIIHLCLFLVYKKQKANFFFFIAAISAVISNSFYSLSLYNIVFNVSNADPNTLTTTFSTISSTFLFIAIHRLNNIKKNDFFWFILGFAVITIFFQLFNANLGGILDFFLLIFSRFVALRLSITTYLSGNKSFLIVVTGLIVFGVLYVVLILFGTSYFFNIRINSFFIIKDLVFLACNWSIPISMLIYISREFGNNSINLENKLIEVQQLSLEKQEALLKQNAELQAALLQGQTIERKRVAADLHDSLGSTMSSLIYTVNAIDTKHLDNDEQRVYGHLKQMLDTAYNEIRLLSHNLLPEEFEKQGLAEALRHFVRKINQTKAIQFDLSIDPQLGRLSPKIEFELYSICLELINNILKHSKATQAQINLSKITPPLGSDPRRAGGLLLVITDNGRGFFDNDSDGKGIKNVKARVESLKGTWHTTNTEGQGVCNEIVVPV